MHRVSAPLEEAAPHGTRNGNEAGPQGDPAAPSILLVDDHPRNLQSLCALLADMGASLVPAHSADEALRWLLRRDFALILLDVQMPGLDGYAAGRLIRMRERCRRIPIVFVTAFPRTQEELLRGYGLGAVDFLSKPFVPEVLRAKVRFFIEQHRMDERIRRQAELLREADRREHARRLAEAQERWERGQLEQRAAELQEADRRKDEFLAMLAHELRNPLTPILNASRLLEHEGRSDARLRRLAEVTGRQARHLSRLVDDLLDLSRIRNGKVELRPTTVDLGKVLADAAQSLEEVYAEHRVALETSGPSEPIALHADPVRLAQVVGNLLQNAAKFTPAGGKVRVQVRRDAHDAVIEVQDDGIGIDPDLLPRIFEPFFQVEQGPARVNGGLGLGLALVKSIVERHGGQVEARSEGKGRGSAFVVRLPALAPDQAGVQVSEAPERAEGGRQLSIVLIEDNDDIRTTLRELLELKGHSVLEAQDGQGGIALAAHHRPDVVLVDLGLPGLDGYGVAEQLLRSASTARLVAVTGYGSAEDRRRTAEAGFHAHLVKPVDEDELTRLLGGMA